MSDYKDEKELGIICSNKICRYNDLFYPSSCSHASGIKSCIMYIPNQVYKEDENVKLGNKKISIDSREVCKNLTVKITLVVKRTWLMEIGLAIACFGLWITGASTEVIEKDSTKK